LEEKVLASWTDRCACVTTPRGAPYIDKPPEKRPFIDENDLQNASHHITSQSV